MKKFKILFSLYLFFLTSNLNSQWTEQISGVTVQLTSVSVPLNLVSCAWICGYNGTILRTTNGGINWLNVSGNGVPNTVILINISALDANNSITAGYIGSNTFVYRTTNAGANWTQVFTENNGFINAVWMTNATNGFMQGDPVGGRWSLWKTTNGGVNWDSTGLYLPQAGTEAGWNNSMFCEGTKIWFGTNNFRVYYSTNSGASWSIQSTGSEQNSYAIGIYWGAFTDGLVGGTSLLTTTNSGTNWSQISSLGTGNFGGFAFAHNFVNSPVTLNSSWYVRNSNTIYRSVSGGTGWTAQYTAPAGNYRHINAGRSTLGGPFWAVRSNGGISYRPAIAGINQISTEIPRSFSLNQNYPNPFNPSTTIRFDILKKGNVKLIVYNSIGSEVAELVNENLNAGSYKYKWDTPKFASGFYYYKLATEEFSETKKMILIK